MNVSPTQRMTYLRVDPLPTLASEDLEVLPRPPWILPLEVNYAEHILAQNSMDIKLNITPNLIDQHLWADQTDDRATFSQSNVPLNQNKVITPAPATHSTSTNLAMNSANLEPFVIPYQANQPVDPIL